MDTIDQDTALGTPAKSVSKRRSYSRQLKRQIVQEALDGSVSVSVVARRYDINANQLFKWRRQYQQGLLADDASPHALLPIEVQPAQDLPQTTTAMPSGSEAARLEITLSNGHRLLITGTVCPVILRTTLEVLSS